jgi:nucleotide-binding universal stress UspA family protein
VFKKILVPVDGSEESKKGLLIARSIADSFQATNVTLLYVLAPVALVAATTPGDERYLSAIPEILVFRQKEGQDVLETAKEALAGILATIDTVIEEGHAAGVILEMAKKGGYDLIVLGSRGLSRVAGFLLGSVSDAVVHHAHCPVLIAR